MDPTAHLRYHTLTNQSGASVCICNAGAAVCSIKVPDKNGVLADVVLSYRDPARFFNDPPFFGKTVGRYANRIAQGRFSLDGTDYQLAINNGPNHLHGGPGSLANLIWDMEETGPCSLRCSIFSPDGEENYPGNLDLSVDYSWTEDNCLIINYTARSDRNTILNITNHSYFNLSGVGSGDILDHELKLFADTYLPIDPGSIPLGAPATVEGTPFDFREFKTIGRDINKDDEQLSRGAGYDHCWVLRGDEDSLHTDCHLAAELRDNKSGRQVTISTTQAGVQVYTGNWLDGNGEDQTGTPHHNRWGVALECQAFPDTPNHKDYPSAVLKANELYNQTIILRFTNF